MVYYGVIGSMMITTGAFARKTPADLKASASRLWIHYDTPSFSIELPDFFIRDTSGLAYTREFHTIYEIFEPLDSVNDVRVTVSKVSSASRRALTRELYKLKHESVYGGEYVPVTIESVVQKKTYFVLRTTYSYVKCILTPIGLYEVRLEFSADFRKEVEPLISHIISSFRTLKS